MPRVTIDTVPYPPGPDPESLNLHLTRLPPHAVRSEALLLCGLLLFLGIYFVLILLCGAVALWLATRVDAAVSLESITTGLGAVILSLVFLFLVKNLLRHSEESHSGPGVEVTSESQPELFAFLQRVAEDVGSEVPRRVILTPGTSAAVVPHVSLANLFRAPSHDLYLGLGLVNALNLSELQAVLAHELAHCTQRHHLAAYSRIVESIVAGLFRGRDFIDDRLDRLRRTGYHRLANALAWGPRHTLGLLELIHRAFRFSSQSLMHERELQADRIAASVAGSEAIRQALIRSTFAEQTFALAESDLRHAAEQKHYSSDIYYHQHAAASRSQAFRDYPPHAFHDSPAAKENAQLSRERERQLESLAIAAPIDTRTPWLLVRNASDLRREVTALILRGWACVPRGATLSDPRTVQNVIDQDRLKPDFPEKYRGAYDDRPLQLTSREIDELLHFARINPMSESEVIRDHAALYGDVSRHAARRSRLVWQRELLLNTAPISTGHQALARLRDLDDRLDRLNAGFHDFDRRVALVHLQMAARHDSSDDLADRYRFHLALQRLHTTARRHYDDLRLFARITPLVDPRLEPSLFFDYCSVLRAAQKGLHTLLDSARRLDFPAMRHFDDALALVNLLRDEEPIDELPAGPLDPEWIARLQRQVRQAVLQIHRLLVKSLLSLLAAQDAIAQSYHDPMCVAEPAP